MPGSPRDQRHESELVTIVLPVCGSDCVNGPPDAPPGEPLRNVRTSLLV